MQQKSEKPIAPLTVKTTQLYFKGRVDDFSAEAITGEPSNGN